MSVWTAARRGVGDFDLVVIDECHHAVAASWRRVIGMPPDAKLLGLTATPERADGRDADD